MPRSAAIYCRISRDRVGAGLGVDRQRADCERLAETLNWTVTAVHTDNDVSAYSGKPRPGYRALLDDIKTGRVDAVLAWHTDRLHRSPVELEEYITACEAASVPTHCVKAGPLDLATPSGRLVARQLGAVARYEVEHMVERQKAAKLQAARNGKYRGGRRPFGYESDGMTVRVEEAAYVLDASRRVLLGESLGSLARDWNQRSVQTSTGHQWTPVSLRDVLIRSRNAGIITHAGSELARAEWPAIVPEDVWRAVRTVLSEPGRHHPRSVTHRWLGTGLYLCGLCADGTTMRSPSSTGGRGGRSRDKYRCKAGPHLTRVAAPVDELITELVIARLNQPDARTLLTPPSKTFDAASLNAERDALGIRLDELATLFADGAVTGRQLTDATARIRGRITEIEVKLNSAVAGSPLAGIADAPDVRKAWESLAVIRRKLVIDVLMTVTLLPAPRGRRPGGHYFDPDAIRVDWER